MCVVEFGAKVGGTVFDFGNAGVCLVGPAHGLGQLLANVGQLLRLLLGCCLLGGQCCPGRVQLAGLTLESLGQFLPHGVQLAAFGFPCCLCAA